jgi:hypothetical protein
MSTFSVANSANVDDALAEEREHDVEVVNHQVEENVDVERAANEDAETLRHDVANARHERLDGDDGGVVALDMTDLQNALVRCGDFDEPLRFVDRWRDRLLYHHVAAGFQQLARNIKVCRRRRGHDRAFNLSRQRGHGVESFQLKAFRNLRGDGVVLLDEADHLGLRHLGENPRVQSPEIAGADDSDLHRMMPRFDSRTNSTRYLASG